MPQRCCREDRKSPCDQERRFSLISFLVKHARNQSRTLGNKELRLSSFFSRCGTSGTRPPGNEIAPRTCCGCSDNSSGLTSRLLHIFWSLELGRHDHQSTTSHGDHDALPNKLSLEGALRQFALRMLVDQVASCGFSSLLRAEDETNTWFPLRGRSR
jgi:hypothetical protein